MLSPLDLAFTHVHILHSIVLVPCKGGCSLHSRASWCRQPPLRNSSIRHTGRCHRQTQCHPRILYRDTSSLQGNSLKIWGCGPRPSRKCVVSGSSPELSWKPNVFITHHHRTCSTASAPGACSWRADSVSCHTARSRHGKHRPRTDLKNHSTVLRWPALGPHEGSL